jgi:ABC-type multidrug transport system fused ATPase/permease subunit
MNMETMRLMNKKNLLNIPIDFSIEVIDTVALIIIIFYAAKLMGMNVLTQSAAMSLVMYVWRIINPIINIVDYFDQLSDDLSLKKDYEEIMSYQNKTIDSGTINLQSFEDKIELKHVGFAYNDSSTILNDVSMVIKKGQRIGICGVSGGGKTTLFKLLNKFYQVTKGEIAIDGINLNDISSESYRKFVGTVHQDNTIFPGTIKENIAYGVSSYTEYELIEACKKANIYEFIMGLEKKFDTEVGPRGVKLSGGQRQRIALARVFMVNPEIILLDEATSALDSESETMIQDAIDNTKDKTIITIAHRLDTIKNCDCIYVMGNHKIVESGTYDELINQHGIFYSMVNTKNKERQ